jgi:hypothetical protein
VATDGVVEATAVIGDAQRHPVAGGGDVDLDGARPGVPGHVDQGLAEHGEQVVDDGGRDILQGTGEPQRGFEAEGGAGLGQDVDESTAPPLTDEWVSSVRTDSY